jgi:hypothetical protein
MRRTFPTVTSTSKGRESRTSTSAEGLWAFGEARRKAMVVLYCWIRREGQGKGREGKGRERKEEGSEVPGQPKQE